ncbi:MAG: DNA repair protein [Paracoccaceae bacterium]|nr:DNA repair protein [Paracoccaceae bacterium]
MEQFRPALSMTRSVFQSFSLALVAGAAMIAVLFSGLAAFGVLPWVEVPLAINGVMVENGGVYAQVTITVLLLCMCFFLPTNQRVLRLESAHHSFSIRMEDVARAYAIAHAEDRKGLFHAPSEFDAVKERIVHLRDHPDLGSLEPDILEVAAQMSRISQDLAESFSDDRVDRAHGFLVQRQQEVEKFQERLDHAKALHADIRQWSNRLELDEAVAKSQLDRLIEDLEEILPEIKIEDATSASGKSQTEGVIRLPRLAAE